MTDAATVTLSDGGAGVSSSSQQATPGATVTFAGIGATSLSDGPISVVVNLFDAAGNVTSWSGTPATKDTVAPQGASSVVVAAGGSNAQGVINLASQGSVSVDATMPSQGAGIQASCTLSDGTNSVNIAATSVPSGGGVVTFSGIDCSGLSDGTITVTITATDAVGNPASVPGSATKDTVAPAIMVDPTTSPTSATSQTVTGQTDPNMPVTITGGQAPANGTATANGRFSIPVTLTTSASNALTVSATDSAGNPGSSTVDFTSAPLLISQSASAPPVTFTDVSVASSLGYSGVVSGGSFQDMDNDGDLDLYVGGANKLFENGGSGVFTEITPGAGSIRTDSAAVWSDFDNDGDLDLLACTLTSAALHRNEWIPLGTRTFTDITIASGATATGNLASAFWLDLDRDGLTDFVIADNDGGNFEVRRNTGGAFTAITPFGPSISQTFFGVAADIIGDKRPDLIFADATPSRFFRNDGGLAFTDVAGGASGVSITQTTEPGGMIAVDYDNDGDLDLVVSAGGVLAPSASCGGCPRRNNQIFRNDGLGSFTEQISGQNVALLAGVEPSDGWADICAGDVNNDGLLDLFVGRNGSNRLFLNVGDLTGADGVYEFVEVSAACGVSGSGDTRLVQLADVDADGDLDLFAANNGTANEVYRNDVNNHRNLTVLVHGAGIAGKASKDGLGARVELLDATGTTLLASREISGGRGLGSQDALRAHFGVTPSEIYSVRVTFVSGASKTVTNVVPRDAAGQTITVDE
jgi:hypothetical protein